MQESRGRKNVSSITDHKAKTLGEKKLKESGLDLKDAEVLRFSFLSGQQTHKLHRSFKSLCSLRIEYYGPDRKPLPDCKNADGFYRLRYLEHGTDFSAMAEKKPVRYVQEPSTAPVAYYPQNQDWSEILKDVDQPIIITEGELKAAKACKEGFPTIGLGGVYNWRSHKLGIEWLDSLDIIVWLRRNVYICFDSDYTTNPMVCAALKAFSEALHSRGAFPHLVTLPQLPGLDKVGLDDFLVSAGPTANNMFRQLLSEAEPLGLTRPLWSLNDRYVYVQNPGLVVDQETKFKVTPSAFKEHLEAPLTYQERSLKQDGSLSYKTTSAAASWLRWPLRASVKKLTYRPGKERFISDKIPLFNVWPGWGVEAKRGDVKPFTQLIDHLFVGAEPEAKQWFLRWCAYPLQHPGTKLFTSACFHGIKHGTGKSLIGYTLARIYGTNFTEINQGDLHANFNEWAEGKQFVLGDDVTGSNKRQDADLLKKMITQRELRVNPKYIPTYVIPDVINYLFTSNQPDAFFLEDDDRRFFIHEIIVQPLEEEFYVEYDLWLDTGGAAAVFDYLLKLDLGGFNPAAHAFRTHAKERMIAGTQSDLGSWCRTLLTTPDQVLKVGKIPIRKDLFTTKELLYLYDPDCRTGTTANGLGRELTRAGARQVLDGKPVKLNDNSQARYYAVRNQEKWLLASYAKISKHLDGYSADYFIIPEK